jgi:hypothetical protein
VSLDSLLVAFRSGETAEKIMQNFSPIRLEDVYATIAYYLQNRLEVEAYLDTQRQEGAAIREVIEKNEATQRMRSRLSTLRTDRNALHAAVPCRRETHAAST